MRKNSDNYRSNKKTTSLNPNTKKAILVVFLFAISLILVLAFFNLSGSFGQYFERAFTITLGWVTYILPIVFIALAINLLKNKETDHNPLLYSGVALSLIALSGFCQLLINFDKIEFIKESGGGAIGYGIFFVLVSIFGKWAVTIIFLALIIIGLLIAFNTDLKSLTQIFQPASWLNKNNKVYPETPVLNLKVKNLTPQPSPEQPNFASKIIPNLQNKPKEQKVEAPIIKEVKERPEAKKVEVPLTLLEDNTTKPTSGNIEYSVAVIQKTLESFGIPVEMREYSVGPAVTQFSFKPIDGIKLSKVVGLQNDLAMALAAHPIRIEAPIPGKSLVGLEVPNKVIAMVRLKEMLNTPTWQKRGMLKFAVGKDVAGGCHIAELTEMPHLLIAGQTGSGKSICLNALILSLLFQKSPDELKLILVDPKRVEMSFFSELPHLWTPIITEPQKAVNALRFLINEMERRLKLFNEVKQKNIVGYNNAVLVGKLPYVVLIIDELYELMAAAGKEIEALIARLASLSRAAGIHLILATQRPSVNVITGVIKANLPARIAFTTASQVDSRTILDSAGAEKLLGKGDMLYQSAVMPKPVRLQGPYVSEPEIERVVKFWKENAEPEYKDEITEKQTVANLHLPKGSITDNHDDRKESEDGHDSLYEEAKAIVIQTRQASATFLQRRLRVGYARAARILDELEQDGIIGPGVGAKNRSILASVEDLGMISESNLIEEAEEESLTDAEYQARAEDVLNDENT